MVTLNKIDGNNRNILRIVGLSTDEKPIDTIENMHITNGSTFKCIDTGESFVFDYENKCWYSETAEENDNIKKSAFENAMYEANYIEHPVELKIPGNVEYVKDRLYMSGVSTDQTSQYSTVPTLRKLTIEEGVKQIGDKAFKGQKYLDRIEFPESLEWVHGEAFDDTEWLERQPEEVYCGQNVFYRLNNLYKNPTDQSRPPSHYEPPIRTVEIKKGTKTISAKAFRGHDRNINCDEIYHVGKLPGLMYLEEISLPSTLTGIGDEAFALVGTYSNRMVDTCSPGAKTIINIPDSVTWIGKNAFYMAHLDGLRIPKNLEVIQDGAYYQSGISGDLIIPDNVKVIGSRAFAKCNDITSIKLHKNIEYIGYNAFSYCSNVTEMWLPSGLNMRMEFVSPSGTQANVNIWAAGSPNYVGYWNKIHTGQSAFAGMTSLTTLHTEPNFDYGFSGYGLINNYLDFSSSPLSVESLEELVHNLKDYSDDGNSYSYRSIKLGSANVAKLSDDLKLEARQKKWTVY